MLIHISTLTEKQYKDHGFFFLNTQENYVSLYKDHGSVHSRLPSDVPSNIDQLR
jgi:hypothetical protein